MARLTFAKRASHGSSKKARIQNLQGPYSVISLAAGLTPALRL